ncbi:PKD domain-containing protein [Desertihabitans brevis]|uniref:PKD domain-containing protein n=1 Tax=Desertihabitans brevis TaxID=2268447 RepID=A0A367YW03_9ACTN|nr:PKD domain-containing protein [Desertihabitans brevis]RCK70063.1 PKD domain-containing protein [Desertihabitans brevis]
MNAPQLLHRAGAAVVALVLAVAMALAPTPAAVADEINLTGPAPIEQRSATTVTADALPTVQLDSGLAWAQVVVGNKVYVGGSFSNARPYGAAKGTSLIPRQNLLAYDITTGQLDTQWAPQVNGTVKSIAASPDGTRIYVGGTFTQANGQTRFNLAAFDAQTGALLTGFRASAGGSYVNAIATSGNVVYVGGLLGAGNGVLRKNLIAFNSNGQLLGWAPTTDLQVDAMVVAPGTDKLIVGGRFAVVNDAPQRGLVALSMSDGSIQPWEAPAHVRNGVSSGPYKGKAGIYGLSADASSVFGTGWVYAAAEYGNFEGVFSAQPESGALNWVADCHGDHYGVYSDGTTVYSTSHEHSCESMGGFPQKDPAPGNMRNATAVTAARKGTLTRATNVPFYYDWSGYPAPAAINWYPDWYTGTASGQGQAGWSVVGTGDYIAVGGEFIGVNGQGQYGLVRFSSKPGNPSQGPRLSGADWVPTASSAHSRSVRVAIPANWDRDDLELSYEVLRDGVRVGTVTGRSSFWNLPSFSYTDTTVQPGRSYVYRVRAVDGDGNSVLSQEVPVTVSTTTLSAYAARVVDDGAELYWRLNGAGGAEADLAGTNEGRRSRGVSPTSPGAVVGDTDAAANFNGTSNGAVASTRSVRSPNVYSVEGWFKTTSNRGGKLFGFGAAQTGTSSSYDRHVWMTNSGRLYFGAYPGSVQVVSSPQSYNDGAWHHVVATQSSAGMRLYVDGAEVAANGVTGAQSYTGYWRVGGDNLGGWPDSPSSIWFNGAIDEFAVYGSALDLPTVRTHHQLGRALVPPTASFSEEVDDLTVAVDGRASAASGGRTITGYSWDFGDDSPATTGATASHTYAEPGRYEVTLTVTDSSGVVGSTSREVTVTAPHADPVAAFGTEVDGLTVDFDGSGSTAADGATITDHDWDFGDDQTGTGASPTHRYARAGTYDVTLTVTDSTGAQGTTTEQVTVTHADPVAQFGVQQQALAVQVDGTGSSASDGASIECTWSWGDDSADGEGCTAEHEYDAAGQYEITLTVTDSAGGESSTSRTVTVTEEQLVAQDTFGRSTTSGWGTAEVGGEWSGATGLSVADGAGRLTVGRSQTRMATLGSVAATDTSSRFSLSMDEVADGGGLHVNYHVRKGDDGGYRLKLRYGANGSVNVGLARMVGTTETLLANRALTGFTQTPGAVLQVRTETVTEGTTTRLRAKVWPDGDAEPSSWLVTTTDSTATLQDAGEIAFSAYGTGTVTNGPVTVLVDDLEVR